MQDVRHLTALESALTERRSIARSNLLVGVMLVLIMFAGGYFRFVGLNWDDFTHLHPDERFLTDVAQGLGRQLNPSGDQVERERQIAHCLQTYPETGGHGTYFDALCSTLNPLNANSSHGLYVYGTLPLFMARGAGELVAAATEWWAANVGNNPDYNGSHWVSYDGIHLVWRTLSALSEMSVIVLVFLIGTKLHDKWIGLLAAFLYAAAVFSIQLAHFGTVDSISNLFTALAILFAVEVQRKGGLLNYALFGAMVGCAVASRINLAPLAGLIVLAAAVQVFPVFDRHVAPDERRRTLTYHAAGLVLSGFLAFLCFRVFNPYAFTGPGFFGLSFDARWLDNMATAQVLNAGTADSPPNFQWVARAPYLYPLNNMVLWGMGLPLGLVSWIGFVWAGLRIVRGKPGSLSHLLLFVWILIYFGWMGRNWVTTMRYFIPIYPPLVILGAWALVAFVRYARNAPIRRAIGYAAIAVTAGFTLLWAGMFTNIYRNLLTRVQASYWVWENVPGDFAMRVDSGDGQSNPLINIGLANSFGGTEDELLTRVTRLDNGGFSSQPFTANATGTITTIHAPHLGDPNDDPDDETLRFSIMDSNGRLVSGATLSVNLSRETHLLGASYDIVLDTPLEVEAGQQYSFNVEVLEGGPIVSGGSVFTWEGSWDDPVPTGVCAFPEGVTLADDPPPGMITDARDCRRLDPWFGLVNGYKQEIVYEDEEFKRQRVLRTLRDSDYIVITSNRFYDTLSRNPARWPWTNFYYDKLFAGELGFEIAAMFQETYELGPLRVSDQYLPTYDAPEWLNEFEAEEAFHVYDHPVVFIFKKSADFDIQRVNDLLYSVPMVRINNAPVNFNCPDTTIAYCDTTIANIATLSSIQADAAPTQLRLTDETEAIQYNGGTWSERFETTSIVNTEPFLAVVIWWLTIVLFGWIVFPLLFRLLPFLADRGYSFAKFTGMFLVAWGTWYLASLRIPVWSQIGIAAGMVVLAAISLAVAWKVRGELVDYLRRHWVRLLTIEAITLIAYFVFVFVRLTNPDLWHPAFGGEKPMDFAYFNGVLRSTVFPPIDPWQSGAFINYYYFGYVIVGAPVLLLGMVPSLAYNLILPTLFATTGIGAFSVAFNIVHRLRPRSASPWLAGIAALLMCVVLGNLDTPRVFLSGMAQMGGYVRPQGIQQFLIQEYTEQNGVPPDALAMADLVARANSGDIGDRLRYELDHTIDLVTSIGEGFGRLLEGQPLAVGAERWFWGPSRVLGETPGVEGQAITEMPIFTFVYGDLHAHMISMPMQLAVMALVLNELLAAGSDARGRGTRFLSAALLGVFVGMLRATNTWDWITYLILGGVGLTLAWWFAWKRLSRRSLIEAAWRIGGFVAVSMIAVLPYTTWYASTYNRILPWNDGKTPLWGYFDIHGMFLFLLVSMLIWETARWLRGVHVRDLRGTWSLLVGGAVLWITLILISIGLSMASYQVTLVVVPLLLWIAALFLRPGQSRPMQFVLLLSALALGLTLGVEYIVLDGDIGRQNTIFKFYLQAWLMFSVVGGAALAWLFASIDSWKPGLRNAWSVALTVLVAVAALLPIMAIQGKAVFRFDTNAPATLDGAEFMTYATHWEARNEIYISDPTVTPFPLNEDYDMIRWLQENVQGTPVIVEGLNPEDTQYKWNGRISIYTGMPTVIGWNWHQRQQRTLESLGRFVESRIANVHAFYELPNIDYAWDFLTYYDVSYVIVGRAERAYYSAQGLAKFPTMVENGMLEVAFEAGASTIYRVNRDADLAHSIERG